MTLHLVHLYPDEMNTYGDRGNRLTLLQRARWRGLDPVVHFVGIGDDFPAETDLVLGGGGQDSAQADIQADVLRKGDRLSRWHARCDESASAYDDQREPHVG